VEVILRFISHRPWVILALIIAVTSAAVVQIVDPATGEPRISFDPSMNRLLAPDDPDVLFYEFVRKLFGSDETMVVAVSAEDVFTTVALERVRRISERLNELPEVHHVVSLTNAVNIVGTEYGLDIGPFVGDEIPTDPDALAAIRRDVQENPIYAGNLVSEDNTTTAIVIYFMNFSDEVFIEAGIDERIEAIAREESAEGELWLAGGPHMKVAQYHYQIGDLQRALPLILIVVTVLLAFSFRSLRAVVVSITTVALSAIWTLGIVGLTGRPLNTVTLMIVPLFAILPLSYCIHVVAGYYDSLHEDPDGTSRSASFLALKHVWLPVVLTGLTTGAGFLALVLSPLGVIREFGMLAVAGIFATVVASLLVPPAMLGVLPRPKKQAAAGTDPHATFTRFASWIATFDLENRRGIFIASGVVVGIAVLAATQIRVGDEGMTRFPADSRVRTDFEAINSNLQGANQFNVVVTAVAEEAFLEPANLRALEELQTWLRAQPEIGGTTSIVEYLKLIHRGFFEGDPARLAIPDSRRLIRQLLLFGASDDLEGFIDNRYQIANVVVRANVLDSELVGALQQRIEERVQSLPEGLEARVTGNPILINGLFGQIVRGQAQSVIAAFVLIYGILWIMFLDWNTALKALVPNVIPVAFYFAMLGITGITLNFATSLIAPMALGIAIDDTIHYFSHFARDAKVLADERRATVKSLVTVGRPVTFTTVVLCAGFLVLAAGDLNTMVQFGALGATTLAFAWVVDFTLTPALCSGLRIVTLYETLTMDLGEDPQRSIPVFRGLSNGACRIVAQMASVREMAAGQPLTRVGDPGSDMYVVIDGNVEVWLDTPAGRRVINNCGRGDVLGEVGFFTGEPRSSNNDIVDDTRLLRFTQNNLERLRRRHPRIASALLRNLNQVQAERLSKQTQLMR
jgi:predicted RND superfamily exporter protein